MGVNTIVSENNNIYTLSQDATDYADDRRWRLSDGSVLWMEQIDLTDNNSSLQVFVRSATGAVFSGETETLIHKLSRATMCINKEETKAYLIYTKIDTSTGLNGRIKIKEIDTSDASTITSHDNVIIVGVNEFTPLRAIISRDEKIWMLQSGFDANLYKMDLDGSNISSVLVGECRSFALSVNNEAFVFGRFSSSYRLKRVTVNGGGSLTLSDSSFNALGYNIDGFIIEDYIYFLFNGNKIYKIPISTWSNEGTWIEKDLTTNYSIVANTTTQFNTDGYDDAGEVYGTFFENNGTDRQRWWRVKLSDLTCQPLRVVNFSNKEFEFSDDAGKDIQRIECALGSDNCDNTALLTSIKGPTGGV